MMGPRLTRALAHAHRLHRTQVRKGPDQIPYISHLLAVAALVIEVGGDEDAAIAALLHDAMEDQGGRKTLDEIRRGREGGEAGGVPHVTEPLCEAAPTGANRAAATGRTPIRAGNA